MTSLGDTALNTTMTHEGVGLDRSFRMGVDVMGIDNTTIYPLVLQTVTALLQHMSVPVELASVRDRNWGGVDRGVFTGFFRDLNESYMDFTLPFLALSRERLEAVECRFVMCPCCDEPDGYILNAGDTYEIPKLKWWRVFAVYQWAIIIAVGILLRVVGYPKSMKSLYVTFFIMPCFLAFVSSTFSNLILTQWVSTNGMPFETIEGAANAIETRGFRLLLPLPFMSTAHFRQLMANTALKTALERKNSHEECFSAADCGLAVAANQRDFMYIFEQLLSTVPNGNNLTYQRDQHGLTHFNGLFYRRHLGVAMVRKLTWVLEKFCDAGWHSRIVKERTMVFQKKSEHRITAGPKSLNAADIFNILVILLLGSGLSLIRLCLEVGYNCPCQKFIPFPKN